MYEANQKYKIQIHTFYENQIMSLNKSFLNVENFVKKKNMRFKKEKKPYKPKITLMS